MPIYHTIDPTLLLQAKVYDDFICERTLETEQFIFTYTMPDESIHKVYNAAKLLSEKLGMKVIDANGNPSKLNAKIKDHRICGPDEFLWYMKHAAYVQHFLLLWKKILWSFRIPKRVTVLQSCSNSWIWATVVWPAA